MSLKKERVAGVSRDIALVITDEAPQSPVSAPQSPVSASQSPVSNDRGSATSKAKAAAPTAKATQPAPEAPPLGVDRVAGGRRDIALVITDEALQSTQD